MPVYEYVCKNCGHKFDALRSMKEADAPIHCDKLPERADPPGTVGVLLP